MDDEPFKAGPPGGKYKKSPGGIEVIADAGEPLGPVPRRGQMFRVLRQVGCHLLAGRWARAHVALTAVEQQLADEAAAPAFETMSRTARRQRFVSELPIDVRTVNVLEEACYYTVGDVLEAWPSELQELQKSRIITNFGDAGMVNIGLALVAWGLVPLSRVQQWASSHAGMSITAADVPEIDRLGRPVHDGDE